MIWVRKEVERRGIKGKELEIGRKVDIKENKTRGNLGCWVLPISLSQVILNDREWRFYARMDFKLYTVEDWMAKIGADYT